jgi:hypothetical protein
VGRAAYKTCNTFHLRGLFISDKLKQHDAARFAEVLSALDRMISPTRRTSARLSGKLSLPSWVRARGRLRTCSCGWGECAYPVTNFANRTR